MINRGRVSQVKKKKAITHKQTAPRGTHGFTVVLKFADEPNKYVGWQTREKAMRDCEYLINDWKKIRNPFTKKPVKIFVKRISYTEWLNLI